jgi:hypothetical protein
VPRRCGRGAQTRGATLLTARTVAAAPRQATTGGRQLLDRKKQRSVQRNAASVLAALRGEGDAAVCAGAALQSLLLHWPHLLELDAAQEWERRYCALALRLHAACGTGAAPAGSAAAAAASPACCAQQAWEEEQREAARLGLLPPARAALLDSAGFEWGLVDRDWEANFDELVAFALGAGHADVLDDHRGAPPGPLRDWARRQMALHRLGSLPLAAEARLRALAFPLAAPARLADPPPALPQPAAAPERAPPAAAAPAERRAPARRRAARAA